jgi:G3E family GTPase
MPKPLLFLTGFLGAGKTTLLRALLNEYRESGRSADVILNDFENAELDASTLPPGAASIAPIAASCACCDSLESLVELCLAAQKSEGDALFIELNGTADPLPLLETFTLLDKKMPFFPRWQVGVVDARHWGKRGDYGPLESRQLETATHWVLTHAEGLTGREIRAISRGVAAINPRAMHVNAALLAADLAVVGRRRGTSLSSLGRDLVPGGDHHDHDHHHDPAHALSHRFTGCQIPLPGRYRTIEVIRFLEALPEEVVRAKALVKLTEAPGCRWLFERTGRHPVGEPLEVSGLTKVATSVVCIGPGLDPARLRELAVTHFGVTKEG